VYQNVISYLYEAQHVPGDTPPIIRSLKLHSSLWFCIILWKVVGGVVAGRCQVDNLPGQLDTLPDSVQHLHVQQLSTYAKPEAASAVLCSWWWAVCRPKHVELHINYEIEFWYTVASCWISFVNYIMKHESTSIRYTIYKPIKCICMNYDSNY